MATWSRGSFGAALLIAACACGGGGGGGDGDGDGGGGGGGTAPPTGLVTGSVSYAGSRSGRVFVSVAYGSAPKVGATATTSLAAPGPFELRGLPSDGTATVMAWIDTLGIGRFNSAADPFGARTVEIVGGAASAGTIALSDPAAGAPPAPPPALVNPDDGALEVVLSPSLDARGFEAADRYTIYWSDADGAGPARHLGKLVVPAGADRARVLGLANGASLFLGVTASAGSSESASTAAAPSPVTVGLPVVDSTFPIQGQVTLPAVAGTLVVFARNVATSAVHLTSVEHASSPASYSIPVRNGTYELYSYLDAGGDGLVAGEPQRLGAPAALVTVAGAPVSAPVIALPSAKASAQVTTQVTAQPAAGNRLAFEVGAGLARPVAVTVTGGPNVAGPLDLGLAGEAGAGSRFVASWPIGPAAPAVGDRYTLAVTYADLTTESLAAQVAAVLAPPVPAAPVGTATSSTPTFSWSAPASPPSSAITYGLTMWSPAGGAAWLSTRIPGGQTSAPYDGPPLATGKTYDWYVWLEDAQGNSASSATVSFVGP